MCRFGGLGEGSAFPDCAYNHGIFKTGYRYKGRAIGHAMDGDGLSFSIGSTLVQSAGHTWNLSLRFIEINRKGEPDSRHTLSETPQDLIDIQLSHDRMFSFGRIYAGIGYGRLDDQLTGKDDIRGKRIHSMEYALRGTKEQRGSAVDRRAGKSASVVALVLMQALAATAGAQNVQLTPAQQQMLNQLPPSQRQQAQQALDQINSQNDGSQQSGITEELSPMPADDESLATQNAADRAGGDRGGRQPGRHQPDAEIRTVATGAGIAGKRCGIAANSG